MAGGGRGHTPWYPENVLSSPCSVTLTHTHTHTSPIKATERGLGTWEPGAPAPSLLRCCRHASIPRSLEGAMQDGQEIYEGNLISF